MFVTPGSMSLDPQRTHHADLAFVSRALDSKPSVHGSLFAFRFNTSAVHKCTYFPV